MRNEFTAFSIISLLIVAGISYFLWWPFIWILLLLVPIILLGFYDMFALP